MECLIHLILHFASFIYVVKVPKTMNNWDVELDKLNANYLCAVSENYWFKTNFTNRI